MEDYENLLLIPRINKALKGDAGSPSIPAPVNVSPAVEGQDPPASGESQSPAFVPIKSNLCHFGCHFL